MDHVLGLAKLNIIKNIIYTSHHQYQAFTKHSKVVMLIIQVKFYFKTLTEDDEVIDDYRKMSSQPFEIIIGKQFQFELWEICVKSMRIGEMAKFTCASPISVEYALFSKNIRNIQYCRENTRTCCSGMFTQSTGYSDLDRLRDNPQRLIFIFDLVDIVFTDDCSPDLMSIEEKFEHIPQLQKDIQELIILGNTTKALDKCEFANDTLNSLLLREKPGSSLYNEYQTKRIVFLLYTSQCSFINRKYHFTIKNCNEILKIDKDNLEALFYRGSSHCHICNNIEAVDDFKHIKCIDDTYMAENIIKELTVLKSKQAELKNIFKFSLK